MTLVLGGKNLGKTIVKAKAIAKVRETNKDVEVIAVNMRKDSLKGRSLALSVEAAIKNGKFPAIVIDEANLALPTGEVGKENAKLVLAPGCRRVGSHEMQQGPQKPFRLSTKGRLPSWERCR